MRQILGDRVEIVVPEEASENAILPLICDADIVVGKLTDKLVDAAKKLRFIQALSAGIDTYPFTLSLLCQRNIKLATAAGGNDIAVAEHALALILACAKKIVPRHLKFQRDYWDKSLSVQIRGKTLGIYGLGKIGIELTKMATCLGMRTIAIKKKPDEKIRNELGLNWLGSFSDLDNLLSESDFLVVCTASTQETEGSVTLEKLKKMKPTAHLIIVSRGNIVDEGGLRQALDQEIIAGAAIDVWWRFPPNIPSMESIHKHPKVTASPHIGGDTPEAAESLVMLAASNIKAFMEGKEPVNLVSYEDGY
jgi:D-3-phosphoglycerate dehydrogenase